MRSVAAVLWRLFGSPVTLSKFTLETGAMKADRARRGVIFSVVAVLLILTNHGETAGGRVKRRRCMVVKNEWRSKGFGDSQQVPSSPVSGKHFRVLVE